MISRKEGTTISDAYRFIDDFQEIVEKMTKEDKKIQINGFLIFTPKIHEQKELLSPLTKQTHIIPKRRVVVVTVGKHFKESLQNGLNKVTEQ